MLFYAPLEDETPVVQGWRLPHSGPTFADLPQETNVPVMPLCVWRHPGREMGIGEILCSFPSVEFTHLFSIQQYQFMEQIHQ